MMRNRTTKDFDLHRFIITVVSIYYFINIIADAQNSSFTGGDVSPPVIGTSVVHYGPAISIFPTNHFMFHIPSYIECSVKRREEYEDYLERVLMHSTICLRLERV